MSVPFQYTSVNTEETSTSLLNKPYMSQLKKPRFKNILYLSAIQFHIKFFLCCEHRGCMGKNRFPSQNLFIPRRAAMPGRPCSMVWLKEDSWHLSWQGSGQFPFLLSSKSRNQGFQVLSLETHFSIETILQRIL